MGKIQLTEREKELLNVLGKHPDISMKELSDSIRYKRVSTIVRKIEQFKKEILLYGPFHSIDYGKLCKNPLSLLFCILEFEKNTETVVSYLKMIESLKTVYPVLSPHKELLNVIFHSSNSEETKALLQLLKDNNIITDYIARASSHKPIIENPNFSGDVNPRLDNLLEPCDGPDMLCGHHDTDWNECDLHILPYLQIGYKSGKLIDIVRAEKKMGKSWTYDQVGYSYRKMLRNGLIEKRYFIFPFSPDQCVDFNLFLRTEDTELTRRILCNFGRGARIGREYALCQDWGYIGFASHPQVLADLMYRLDTITEIKEKELYQIRSVAERKFRINVPLKLKYFDLDSQAMEYPYRLYREKIKERIENE